MIACTHSADDIPGLNSKVSKDELVLKIIEDFRSDINPTKSRSADFKVKSITRKDNYPAGSRNGSTSSEIVSVEFQSAGIDGYAILRQDGEHAVLLFYTDNGHPEDIDEIEPLKGLLTNFSILPDIPITPIDTTHVGGKDSIDNSQIGYVPFDQRTFNVTISSKTEWSQSVPYNWQAPECNCFYCMLRGGHQPIGCSAVAIGQFLTAVGKYRKSPNCPELDFTTLRATAHPQTFLDSLNVSIFLREIADRMYTTFGCGGSGASTSDAEYFLRNQGYGAELSNYNETDNERIYNELSKNRPHIIRGERLKDNGVPVGHIWLITGMKQEWAHSGGTTIALNRHYCCNWGWGSSSNGWILGNPYSAPNGLVYELNIRHIYINSIPE